MPTNAPLLASILKPEANNFGVIRLAMALAVLVSHAYLLATGQTALEPLKSITGHTLGEHAVQVFFFLSGVVVTQSLMRSRSVVDFAVGRALRIFPALVVCVLLTVLLLGPLVTSLPFKDYLLDKGLVAYLAKTLSLSTGSAPLPGIFADNPAPGLVNLSLWTLKFEVGCYALLTLFGAAYIRLERWRTHLAVALAAVLAVMFVGPTKPVGNYTSFDNIRYFGLYFGAGVLAFLAKDRLVVTWWALPPLAAVFWAGIGTGFSELAGAAFLGYATLWAASLPTGQLRTFTNGQDYSYGVYILHCPVQQALVQHCDGIQPLTLAAVTTLAVLPLAILSWNVIEAPAMAWRKTVVGRARQMGEALLSLRGEPSPAVAGSAPASPGGRDIDGQLRLR